MELQEADQWAVAPFAAFNRQSSSDSCSRTAVNPPVHEANTAWSERFPEYVTGIARARGPSR